ncbi:putative tetratricopeptide-like helical domain superfamily [Helianthus annuus]|uniref:Putative tetratricopeptide-like helical domain-containing protein n=1 Tax=Helianthus annuus TaxID=4232 RepID=A0A251SJY6_HELAN|nr:pentatricopeptide repeat-containing protein At5g56310 [Helianthus annuus]KAF5769995.1 putative tetratricopeptide-like helical domain superfamily [Helianthus annuus]KAJ0464946.1 putative tetratricopeptide-like helical domain superfamily [Helianthus annuus]KAJ0469646.1 putative tetratricopeptide-like helical domain superfamily [Helianthus annuus]KAJ0486539.1 putative tetratricopeptide-like helical domain superfamily [Helianthus annuus]KAJ0657105.1 putative tetratricopeptide-like helical domai
MRVNATNITVNTYMFRRPLIGNHRPPSSHSTIRPAHTQPHLSLLADKCSSMRQLLQIHAQMLVTATIHDNFAASRLLSFSALSPHGDLNYASKLLNSVQQPNMFMWNTLIRGLAISPNPHEAVFLYVNMRRIGVTPGKHTFPFVLKACSGLRSVELCKQVHSQVVKVGLDLDFHVVNNLIRGYSVSSGLVLARQVFDEMPDKNVNVWTTMVCGYAQNDRTVEALDLFNQMVAEGFEPNGPSLSSVLSACAQSGCLDMGEKIHRYIMEKGLGTEVILGTALVNMYAKNGALVMARTCFDNMPQKNIITWNVMISGLAVHGHAKEALDVFQVLEKYNVMPNDSTFVGVLSACCHAGMLDFGRKIFNSMRSVYGIEPKIQHYGCMVDLLGRGGMLSEAEELINRMPWKADLKILGALLSACGSYGNIEVAERAVKKMLVLEHDNHGVYVVLSNMYADAGRWDDVSRLREIMKDGSLKKTPGWSLVGDKDELN